MQLAASQLPAHLARGVHPLYVLSGDEPLLVQEAADAIRAAARAAGAEERQVFQIAGAHPDWVAVRAAGSAMSLFAPRQLLELHIPGGKPGKDGGEALEAIAAAADAEGPVWLVLLPRLDAATRKSAWFEALSARGVLLMIEPVERAQLPAWIAQRLARHGLRVVDGDEGQQALQLFADRVEGHLLAAHQEVEKLALLHPDGGVLTLAMVDAAVGEVARFDAQRLTEAALAGQPVRVQRVLDGLQAEGASEVYLSWLLAEDIRALRRVRAALDAGRPLPLALREQRIWGAREKAFERALPRLTAPVLARLLQDALRVDGICKGLRHEGWPGDGWQALARLAVALARAVQAGAARPGTAATGGRATIRR